VRRHVAAQLAQRHVKAAHVAAAKRRAIVARHGAKEPGRNQLAAARTKDCRVQVAMIGDRYVRYGIHRAVAVPHGAGGLLASGRRRARV
jgi:hypothetical protein